MTNKVIVNSTTNKVVATVQENKVIISAKGARGPAGISGAQFFQGTTPPDISIGDNGDSYLNTNTSLLYLKVGGVWTGPTKIAVPSIMSFSYEQQTPKRGGEYDNGWHITHNLGFRPSVSVMDYGSNNVECDIEHINENSIILTFSEEVSGYAYLS
jgi:hypothetical protein